MKRTLIVLAAGLCLAGFAKGSIMQTADFSKSLHGWNTPNYWAGKTTQVEDDGRKVLLLESGVRNNTEHFGKSFTVWPKQYSFFPGQEVSIKLTVKGTGEFQGGVMVYIFGSGAPEYRKGDKITLSGDYKTYEAVLTMDKMYRMVLPYMEVVGDGKAYVKDFEMKLVNDDSISVKAQSSMQVCKTGDPIAPAKFETNVKSADCYLTEKVGNTITVKQVKSDASGNVSAAFSGTPAGLHDLTLSRDGISATAYAEIQAEPEYQATDALAKQVRLPRKLNVLFLGDSLTDFYRGYNYVDRLNFWVNKYNPGKFTFKNLGVGGDQCPRMEQRMSNAIAGRGGAYRQEMYNGIFDEQYDVVFLFLGQNDTVCFRKDNFSKPQYSTEQQIKGLTSIVKMIREKEPKAKIIFISPSPSNVQVFIDRDKKWPKDRGIAMFGKVEFVNAYDAANRQFCKENNIDYIDILTVMRAWPNLADLYGEDAVHLSPLGGRVIADEILKYLGKASF